MSKLRLNLSGPKLKPKFWWEALSGGVREGGVIWSWRKKWRHLWMAPGVLNTLPPRHLSTDRSRKKVFFFFFAFSHKTIIMLPSLHWCSILGCFNIFMTASKKLLLLAQNYYCISSTLHSRREFFCRWSFKWINIYFLILLVNSWIQQQMKIKNDVTKVLSLGEIHEPLQSCCCPVQKNLSRKAELAWKVSRYLWRGWWNFKIKTTFHHHF